MAANSLQPAIGPASEADYYPSVLHVEALARLAYLAGKASACGLLLGPKGCGKSLVLDRFARIQRKAGVAVVLVSAVGVSAANMLANIASAWGGCPKVTDDLSQLWQKAADRLRVLGLEQIPAILLVDDLDQARDDVATMIDQLHAFADGMAANLVLVAAADELSQGLLSPRFLARVELRVELDLWTLEESSGFLQVWLAQRAGNGQEFDAQAMEVLHDLAEGVPRRVRQLAELTLVAGSRAEGNLSEEVVEAAYQELNLGR
jgi:type II secretory pathway predicted ATPase ExeA